MLVTDDVWGEILIPSEGKECDNIGLNQQNFHIPGDKLYSQSRAISMRATFSHLPMYNLKDSRNTSPWPFRGEKAIV